MGVAMAPEHGQDYGTLFPLADGALYTAKQNGKHGYAIHRKEVEPGAGKENLRREFIRISQIIEERNEGNVPFVLGPEPFSFIYRFVKRFYTRHGGKAVKMLFALSGDEKYLHEEAERFCWLLQKKLRKSDIIMQNKPTQFFLFLPELSEQDMNKVIERIMDAWGQRKHDGVNIEYIMEPVVFDESLRSSEVCNL